VSSSALTVVDPTARPHGPVARVDEVFIETRDGCRLSARVWLPAGVDPAVAADASSDAVAAPERFPAVVEVLPYGVHRATADTDEATWPYLAGHGVACVRVDSRGAGNSEGVLDDEYSAQQQRDACDAVEWVASRTWCTGAVGLMGCSWGGFVALQAAALAGRTGSDEAPEAPSLRAVCAVCAAMLLAKMPGTIVGGLVRPTRRRQKSTAGQTAHGFRRLGQGGYRRAG
jgi:putative CocE/NonD family hydrolase